MLILIGCIGLSIDVGRSVLVKARLSDALDAAGLAVGARVSTTDFSGDAKNFVTQNFASKYAGATVTNVTATANSTKSVITLSATATMPAAFMKLFGTNTVTVKATSEITRSSSGLELVMALDNTGSMSSSMTSLKTAANALLDVVFGPETVGTNLYVGLVPFSQAVNINGAPAKNWTTSSSYTNITCVEELYLKANTSAADTLDVNDQAPSTTATKFPKLSSSSACPQKMLAMTRTKSTITSAIGAMSANGSTHVNLGAIWAWRMLSPKWRTYWSGDMATYSLPLDYGTVHMSKAVVLMTDGANTFGTGDYTAYRELDDKRLGTKNQTAAEGVLDTRLTSICGKMKSAGIVVYTVGFNLGTSPDEVAIKNILAGCATSGQVIEANAATIKAKFQDIGGALSNLRVSK
jgi:Flp pilus assembly protein TadG